jgi:hypothetical protein
MRAKRASSRLAQASQDESDYKQAEVCCQLPAFSLNSISLLTIVSRCNAMPECTRHECQHCALEPRLLTRSSHSLVDIISQPYVWKGQSKLVQYSYFHLCRLYALVFIFQLSSSSFQLLANSIPLTLTFLQRSHRPGPLYERPDKMQAPCNASQHKQILADNFEYSH